MGKNINNGLISTQLAVCQLEVWTNFVGVGPFYYHA